MTTAIQDWLLDQLGQQADIPRNLLGAIIDIEHATPGTDYRAATDTLWAYLNSGYVDNAAQVSQALGNDQAKINALQAEWNGIKDSLRNQLPEGLRPFARQLNELSAKLAYPVTKSAAGAPAIAGVPFNLSASAALALEIEAHDQASLDSSKIDIALASDERALRLGIAASLKAGAKATIPEAWGSVGLNASAGVAVSADVYFRQQATRYLVEAVAANVTKVPAPGNLTDALEAAAAPNAGKPDFAETRVKIAGTLTASADIKAGYGTTYEYASLTPNAPKIQVAAGVSGQLTLSWRHEDTYLLIVKPDPHHAGAVHVSLEVDRSDERARALKLGVDIGVTGLAENLDAILKRALPDATPWIDRINQELDLAGTLRGRLKAAGWLTDNTVKGELAKLATGQINSQTVQDDLVKWLSGQVQSWVDARTPSWLSADPQTLATSFVDEVVSAWGISNQAVTSSISLLLVGSIQQAQADITGKIAGLVTKLDAEIKAGAATIGPLLAPFEAIGKAVNDVITEIQKGPVGQAADWIKDWLNQYNKVRHDLLAVVQKVAEERVALTLSASSSRTSADSKLFSVTIYRETDATVALYRAMWAGRFERLATLVQNAGADISDPSGQFTYTLLDKSEWALSFNLFGLQLSSSAYSLADVRVEADNSGRITLVHGKGDIGSIVSGFGAKFNAQLGFDVDLLAGIGASTLPLPLSSTFSATDEKLTQDEFDRFVGSLDRFGLVRGGAANDIWTLITKAAGPQDSVLRDTTLQLKFQLNSSEFKLLLGLDRETVYRTACEHLLAYAIQTLHAVENFADGEVRAFLQQRAHDAVAPSDLLLQAGAYASGTDLSQAIFTSAVSGRRVDACRAFWYAARQALGIADGFASIRQAYELVAANPGAEAVRDQAGALLKKASDQLSQSVSASESLFKILHTVPWRDLAFYATVGTLVGREAPYGLVVTVAIPKAGNADVYVIH